MGVMKTEQDGAYWPVKANADGKLPVVKVWDEASGKYVPVTWVTGGGVELPELTRPASASRLEAGYQLIGQDGNVVMGTAEIAKNVYVTVDNRNGSGLVEILYTQVGGGFKNAKFVAGRLGEISVRKNSLIVVSGVDADVLYVDFGSNIGWYGSVTNGSGQRYGFLEIRGPDRLEFS